MVNPSGHTGCKDNLMSILRGMKKIFGSSIARLRVIAIVEGWSFLILLGIAMPLKYLADMPGAVRVVGMAHGLLFVAYILLVVQVKLLHRWSARKAFLAMFASVIPFGTFYVEKKWLRETNLAEDPASGKKAE